jgi:hypothetical protein
MRQPSFPTPRTRPISQSGATAVIAGAAMGAIAGARAACHLGGVLPGPDVCALGGAPAGALVGALVALGALPLLGQGTRPGEHAAHRPAPTTTTAARLVWLAIAAALARWLAEGLLHPQMGLEGVVWMGILPVVLVAAAGLAMAAQGLLGRRGWARWAAVVAFSLLAITALAGLVDWIEALMRSRADGRWPIPAERVAVDLATPVLFLAISVGVIVLLMTPATRRDFRSSRQPPAGTNGRQASSGTRQA